MKGLTCLMTWIFAVMERGKRMSDITDGIKQLGEHIKIVDAENGGRVVVIKGTK